VEIKAILIDFGGVLVRTKDQRSRIKWEIHLKLAQGELTRLVFESDIARQATLGKIPDTAIWDNISDVLKINHCEISELEFDFWKNDELDYELRDYLKGLRPIIKTGILSNAWLNARHLFSEKYHLDEVVDDMIISAEVGLAKPDPQIYLLAANKLGVKPEDTIFIDDMPENIAAAENVGMVGIQFKNTLELIKKIQDLTNR
jgi:epoxide hydrolase-like predicted phosphatase